MNDGAKSLYGALIGAGGSSGGGGGGADTFKITIVTPNDQKNQWFKYDAGMTWGDFIASEYNPILLYEIDTETQAVTWYYQITEGAGGHMLYLIDGTDFEFAGDTIPVVTDLIDSNAEYKINL